MGGFGWEKTLFKHKCLLMRCGHLCKRWRYVCSVPPPRVGILIEVYREKGESSTDIYS